MRAISPSIQASARAFTSSARSPAVSIAGPMLTVMVPGVLKKALRPQNSPELSATGSTGAPALTAMWAPPILKRRCWPGSVRVPSGKITTG